MARLRFFTAGESHGEGLVAFVEGLPAGVVVDLPAVDRELRRRQGGYGRGLRMALEEDRVRVLAGLKRGRTLGSPVAFFVANRNPTIERYRRITRPRPGHADLAGALKYGTLDCADIMERASARETVARVAAGALAAQVLRELGIEVFAWVTGVGSVRFTDRPGTREQREALREASPFYSLDPEGDLRARALVEELRDAGDTVGGAIRVEARGVPAGLGSPMQWDLRLDGRLAQALMAIPAIKAVAIGDGMDAATATGLSFHDPIVPEGGGVKRPTNRAGGIEGGMSNGEAVIISLAMKPIPSVKKTMPSLDLETGAPEPAVYERSDVCAVPAASVVAEAVTALVLLDAVLEKFGGDSWPELRRNLQGYATQGFPRGAEEGRDSSGHES